MKRIARDHYEDTFLRGPYFDAADPDCLTVCMHNSPADFTWGNTASSCVAVLPAQGVEPARLLVDARSALQRLLRAVLHSRAHVCPPSCRRQAHRARA